MASTNQFDIHSEDYVKNMRIRFREQAARFLEDVSFDVGAVLARDLSLQDEDTKNRLSELHKGLSEQVQHMHKVIKKDKSILVASTAHRHKKDIHFTQNELKTLQEIAKQENDPNGVVSMFLKRREEGAARNRYKEFVKRAEAKYFEHRRDGRKGKFDFRHVIRDSMRLNTNLAHSSDNKKRSKANRVPKLTMPGEQHSKEDLTLSEKSSDLTRSEVSISPNSDHPTSIRSAPNMLSARLASYKSANHSTRWKCRDQLDPDSEAVKTIVNELAETVELLLDFEHQPFHTAVPPQYSFYKQNDTIGDIQPDQAEEGEPAVDDEDRNDGYYGISGEPNSNISEDQPDQPNDDYELMQKLGRSLNDDDETVVDDEIIDDKASSRCDDAEGRIGVDEANAFEESKESAHHELQIMNAVIENTLSDTEVQEVMQEVLTAEIQPVLDEIDEEKEDSNIDHMQFELDEPKPISVLVEKSMKSVSSRGQSNQSTQQRFMAPKSLQTESTRRCHRVNRESTTTIPQYRRTGNRSRSPWRHPERFPQIRNVKSRPHFKKQLKPLARNQSNVKLLDTK